MRSFESEMELKCEVVYDSVKFDRCCPKRSLEPTLIQTQSLQFSSRHQGFVVKPSRTDSLHTELVPYAYFTA